eukprot:scaffold21699_cov82-Skeletonema_dohrnii-CCMP3373.AAC.2
MLVRNNSSAATAGAQHVFSLRRPKRVARDSLKFVRHCLKTTQGPNVRSSCQGHSDLTWPVIGHKDQPAAGNDWKHSSYSYNRTVPQIVADKGSGS